MNRINNLETQIQLHHSARAVAKIAEIFVNSPLGQNSWPGSLPHRKMLCRKQRRVIQAVGMAFDATTRGTG